jgi:hypothetical protein
MREFFIYPPKELTDFKFFHIPTYAHFVSLTIARGTPCGQNMTCGLLICSFYLFYTLHIINVVFPFSTLVIIKRTPPLCTVHTFLCVVFHPLYTFQTVLGVILPPPPPIVTIFSLKTYKFSY